MSSRHLYWMLDYLCECEKRMDIKLIIWGPHEIIWGPHLGSRPQLWETLGLGIVFFIMVTFRNTVNLVVLTGLGETVLEGILFSLCVKIRPLGSMCSPSCSPSSLLAVICVPFDGT